MSMKILESKWVGGSTARDYKSGSVSIKCIDADKKLSVRKIYYIKPNGKNPISFFEVANSHGNSSEQVRSYIPNNLQGDKLKHFLTDVIVMNHESIINA
tara:strand:+ start:1439 stop:1735 length:297 start_codon:yes stop_codon:yes gene_type:complete